MRTIRVQIGTACSILALFIIASCSTLVVAPETFNESVALAKSQVAAAYDIVADLKTRGRITASQRDRFVADIDVARDAVNAAALSGDADKLQASIQLLSVVESALRSVENR